ncbi:glycosyltransferase family 4 protein [Actinomadura sp. WMMB 499]|uniref:glycosyltransferase family 4 protein n=1 Tax=Actinomadura sp. WMMB 499 TaxID=1219491 RepID=UPI001246D4A0|nr:glycosyltransferase family 4 protein [Actinomadura sp. WMMB 499]QFG21451.1 glycosyltransferase family 4 protein [Actinomadura sp. WMMB 499]
MKIVHVVNQYPPNVTTGLGRYIELIVPRLAREHRLAVFTLGGHGGAARERDGRVAVHRAPARITRIAGAVARRRPLNRTRRLDFALLAADVVASNWRYVRRLRRARDRPDLVVVHDTTNFLCGLLCHYALRLPVVLHVHTTEYGVDAARRTGFGAVERWLGRVARRVVVPTPEIRDRLRAAGWDARTPIDVVPLGATYEPAALPGPDERARQAAALRARLGIRPDTPVLLFTGRLERQKGVYELVEALPEIVAAVPEVCVVLAGEGDRAGVRRIAARAGLSARLLTPGFVRGEELAAYYAMADACVFPSRFEPFGLVATEAMALGRPTILGAGFSRIFAGDDPVRPAVHRIAGTGPGDVAAAVIAVLTDGDARRDLGERGERLVRERLSWERAAAETSLVHVKAVRP